MRPLGRRSQSDRVRPPLRVVDGPQLWRRDRPLVPDVLVVAQTPEVYADHVARSQLHRLLRQRDRHASANTPRAGEHVTRRRTRHAPANTLRTGEHVTRRRTRHVPANTPRRDYNLLCSYVVDLSCRRPYSLTPYLDGEVDRKPTEHSRRVCLWHDTCNATRR